MSADAENVQIPLLQRSDSEKKKLESEKKQQQFEKEKEKFSQKRNKSGKNSIFLKALCCMLFTLSKTRGYFVDSIYRRFSRSMQLGRLCLIQTGGPTRV